MPETPRSSASLKQWTAPLVTQLKGEDAIALQRTFASLTEYINALSDTVSSNYYNLSIGTVTSGSTPTATIRGTFPNQILDLGFPSGATGPSGPTGPTGPAGYAIADLDGGYPDSVYGGITSIDGGAL